MHFRHLSCAAGSSRHEVGWVDTRALAFIYLANAIANTLIAVLLAATFGAWALLAEALAGSSAYPLMCYIMGPYRPWIFRQFPGCSATAPLRAVELTRFPGNHSGWIALALEDKENGRTTDMEFSLVLVTMFLVSPISWEHHLVFVLPAVLVHLRSIFGSRNDRLLSLVAAAPTLVLAWRFPAWARVLKSGILTLGISLKFYAASALWVFLLWALWRVAKSHKTVPLLPRVHGIADGRKQKTPAGS